MSTTMVQPESSYCTGDLEIVVIKKSTFVRLLKAGAFTVWPWVFLDPGLSTLARATLIDHERVHLRQQLPFCLIGMLVGMTAWIVMGWPLDPWSALIAIQGLFEGWVAGALLWRFLYLCVLPWYWNPFRRHWETEAFKVSPGLKDEEINRILSCAPYHLRRL